MQAERLRDDAKDRDQWIVPRASPSARFVHDLDRDIRRAARQQVIKSGIRPSVPFEEMVIELRKLVRLLRRTLVPLRARAEFSRSLGQRLQNEAIVISVQQQHRVRWFMVGGMVGSLLSVLGLLAAWLLRRRNGQGHSQMHAKKSVGAA
jgi:hypothetical protein